VTIVCETVLLNDRLGLDQSAPSRCAGLLSAAQHLKFDDGKQAELIDVIFPVMQNILVGFS